MRTGDKVRQADGTTGTVWLRWNVEKTQEMYNLTVDEAHTFFVGDGQWLVHNAGLCPFDNVTQTTIHQTLRNLDDTAIGAFRSRPPNALKWEGIYRPKSTDFHVYQSYGSGRRWGQFGDGSFGWAYSDIDVAGITTINGPVEGQLFVNKFQDPFNKLYWQLRGGVGNEDLYKVIQHEALAQADLQVWTKLLNDRGMDGVMKMLKEDVYLFGPNRYLGSLPFSDYLGSLYYR